MFEERKLIVTDFRPIRNPTSIDAKDGKKSIFECMTPHLAITDNQKYS